ELIAPPDKITSLAFTVCSFPFFLNVTPVTLFPSKFNFVTNARVCTSEFLRFIAGCKYALDADTRRPFCTWLSHGPNPSLRKQFSVGVFFLPVFTTALNNFLNLC